MKEIGEFLKSSRINNGVSIEEAADDLNLSVTQIENIEEGNTRAFKDLYALKNLVKEYGKYLGVETDSILDEFNDFMFEHTSKISLDDIKEARALKQQEEEKNKVVSPYTRIKTKKEIPLKPIIITLSIILGLLLFVFIIIQINSKEDNVTSELMGNEGNEVYEFTY